MLIEDVIYLIVWIKFRDYLSCKELFQANNKEI